MTDKIYSIVDMYCTMHQVTREDLAKTGKHKNAKKRKVINGVNVATLRMALGYYLTNNFPISLSEVAKIIGYNDHSTISYNNKKIYFYIKNEDAFFMYFYRPLVEIGKLYEPVKFDRMSKSQYALLK